MKIGIISDIHEDIDTLTRALHICSEEECEEIVCLGDIVGFNPTSFRHEANRNANECLAFVRAHCSVAVPGNHDLHASRRFPEFTAGFDYPHNWFDLDIDTKRKPAENNIWFYDEHDLESKISSKNLSYLHSLPSFGISHYEGLRVMWSHYPFPDISGTKARFINTLDELQEHKKFIHKYGCNISFSGHSHVEGLLMATETYLESLDFGEYSIPHDTFWINVPCIASGKKQSGLTIWKPLEHKIHVRKL